jgi:hypothetical protein
MSSIVSAVMQAYRKLAESRSRARRDPSVDDANFDAAQQGNLAFREELIVESTSELATSAGGKLPTDGALHPWALF